MITIEVKQSKYMPGDLSLYLSFPYEQFIVDTIKLYPKRSWHKRTKEWELPLNELDNILADFEDYNIIVKGEYVDLSPRKEVTEIDFSFKTEPFSHQRESFLYGMNHDRWFLGDEQGCIWGDCKVQIKENGKSATRRIKLEHLYENFKKDNTIQIKSLVNGRFAYMPIKNVLYKGWQFVVEIVLEDTSILCTSDHLIYTDKGWVKAGDISVGDKIYTNGQEVCPNCGTTENLITKGGKFQGYCKKCMYKLRNGKKFKTDYERVKEDDGNSYIRIYGKSIRNHPLYKYHSRANSFIYEHHLVWYEHTGHIVDTYKEQIHHKNGIKFDNRFENLQLVTLSEHAKLHADTKTKHLYQFNKNLDFVERKGKKIWLVPRLQTVTEKHYHIDKQKVYDIVIDSPDIHNFICNNVVVHNCGKTKQTIDIAVAMKQQRNYKHCLIICCVNGLKWNWKNEINIHSDEEGYILGQRVKKKSQQLYIGGNKAKLEDLETLYNSPNDFQSYFIITNVETFRNKEIVDLAAKLVSNKTIQMIIIDECHKGIKENINSSQQGKGILKLQPEYRIAMTGTPLMNSPLDLYGILRWLGIEKHAFYTFKNYYAVMGGYGGYEVIGYKHLDELEEQFNSIKLRRLKEDVLDLPEKTYINEYVDMLPKQAVLYKEIKADVQMNIDKIEMSPNPLAEMIRMRQVTGYTGILSSEILCSAKLDRMEELVDESLENGRKVVIFSNWTSITDAAYERLQSRQPLVITGQTPDEARQEFVDDFQKYANHSIMLGTYGALGTGVTLTKATVVILLDEPWSKALLEQAIDRVHRIGQDNKVTIHTIMCKDTIDEKIHKLVEKKGAISDIIVDGKSDKITKEMIEYLLD